jgi:hypothetical protein
MTPGKSVYLKGKTKLIGTEGTRLLREYASKGDPTGASAPRRLPDRPRKASALRSNQRPNLYKPKKTVDKLDFHQVCLKSEPPVHQGGFLMVKYQH